MMFAGRGFDGKYWGVRGSESFVRYFPKEDDAADLCMRINGHLLSGGSTGQLRFLEWLWAWGSK